MASTGSMAGSVLLVLTSAALTLGFVPQHSSRPVCIGQHTASSCAQGQRTHARHMSMSTAPKDASAEYVRQELARKQAEYEQKRKATAAADLQRNRGRGGTEQATPLADLPFVPYLNEAGLVTDLGVGKDVKASVYAIFDESNTLVYIGVSRGVQQSLRLHLARVPESCYSLKLQHITRPSRTLLELIKDSWIKENGSTPVGNDNGPVQNIWENPLDVRPLMTEQDKEDLAAAKARGREDSQMKKIARRFEDVKTKIMADRGIKENLRFDPKLKAQGLLDLWGGSAKPANEVPSDAPGKK